MSSFYDEDICDSDFGSAPIDSESDFEEYIDIDACTIRPNSYRDLEYVEVSTLVHSSSEELSDESNHDSTIPLVACEYSHVRDPIYDRLNIPLDVPPTPRVAVSGPAYLIERFKRLYSSEAKEYTYCSVDTGPVEWGYKAKLDVGITFTPGQVRITPPDSDQRICCSYTIRKFYDITPYLAALWDILKLEVVELNCRIATIMLAHGMGSNYVAIIRYWLNNLGAPRQLIGVFLALVAAPVSIQSMLYALAVAIKEVAVFTFSHAMLIGLVALGLYFIFHGPSHYFFYKITAHPTQNFDYFDKSCIGQILTEQLAVYRRNLSPSHRTLCRVRDSFVASAPLIAARMGRRPYFVGLSRRTASQGHVGISRFSQPDLEHLNAPQLYDRSNDLMLPNDLLIFQDTDYYLNMNQIAMLGLPMLIFTFVPQTSGCATDEISYWFDSGDFVAGKVNGGRKFRHQIWDYGDDKIDVTLWGYRQSYKVFNYHMEADSFVRYLEPIGCGFLDAGMDIPRKRFLNNMCVINVIDGNVHLGVMGIPSSLTLTIGMWSSILATVVQRSSKREEHSVIKSDLNIALKAHFVASAPESAKEYEITKDTAAFVDTIYPYVVAYIGETDVLGLVGDGLYSRDLTGTVVNNPNHTRFDDELDAPTYQFRDGCGGDNDIDDSKVGMLVPITPFIAPALVPDTHSASSILDMADKRVLRPQKQAAKATDSFDPEIIRFMLEIIELVFKGINLVPVDDDEVAARMNTPSQRNHREEWEQVAQMVASTVFIKMESYASTKAYRPITVNNGTAKWELARYIYALMDFLKGNSSQKPAPWFVPGMSPFDIAQRIADVCSKASQEGKHLVKTDYIKWDGSVGAIIRLLIHLVISKVFDGYSDPAALNDKTYGELVRIKIQDLESIYGPLFFHPGFSLGSGNQITSFLGCFGNMFTAYVYFRRVEGMSPEEAYAALGAYMGDDGATAVKNLIAYVETAASLGLNLEAEACGPDNPVQFLSRYYSPDVFRGRLDSCCDIKRQMQKITYVDRSWQNDMLKHHWLKCKGYLLTDRNTPFIGPYCELVEALCEPLNYKMPFDEETATEQQVLRAFGTRTDYLSYHAVECYVHHCIMPNNNADGWMCGLAENILSNFDFDGINTWVSQQSLTAPSRMTGAQRKKYILDVLALLNTHPQFGDDPIPEITPCVDRDIVVHTKDDSFIVPSLGEVVQITPPSTIAPVDMNQEIGLRLLSRYITSNPWGLKEGGLKCMLVNWLFYEQVLADRRPRGSRSLILYTGSYGDTHSYAAQLFSQIYSRTEFFDMQYAVSPGLEQAKELDKFVVVRATRFTRKMAEELREKNDVIYWLDDMYMGDNSQRAHFNDFKCQLLEVLKPKIASIKIMTECESYVPTGPSVKFYRTPQKAPFHEVREIRCVVYETSTLVKRPIDEVEAAEIPLWKAMVSLNDCDEELQGKPGRPRPQGAKGKPATKPDRRERTEKVADASKDGGQGTKAASGSGPGRAGGASRKGTSRGNPRRQ